MLKPALLSLALVALVIEPVTLQRIVLPTYRPPVRRGPVIRTVRAADRDTQPEPLWLHQGDGIKAPASGDHPVLPGYIDDVVPNPHRRYVRSIENRMWKIPKPFKPSPTFPNPIDILKGPRVPLYARTTRDVHFPGPKPSHRDVVIPNWNPHVKTNPWNQLGRRQNH